MYIEMPRGDIRPITFGVYEPDGHTKSDIVFTEIYFTCKRFAIDDDYLFQKRLTDGSIVRLDNGDYSLRIMPEDTNDLMFDTEYAIDIEILYYDQIKQTTAGRLKLTEETTAAQNEVV